MAQDDPLRRQRDCPISVKSRSELDGAPKKGSSMQALALPMMVTIALEKRHPNVAATACKWLLV